MKVKKHILLCCFISLLLTPALAQKNKNKEVTPAVLEEEVNQDSAEVTTSTAKEKLPTDNEKEEICQIDNKKALTLYESAMKDYRSGKSTDAKAKLDAALEAEPNFAKAYILLGEMSYKSNPKAAKEYYEKSIEICGNADFMVLFKLAKMYYDNREFLKSVQKFTAFIDANSNKPNLIHEADSLIQVATFYDKILNHPVPFDPTLVPGVNTSADEYLPVISPDNDIFLFTRKYLKQSDKFGAFSGGKMVEEFTMAKKENGAFNEGKALPPPFNAGMNEGGACLTLDNKTMFITICNVKGGYGSCDIWNTTQKEGKWMMMQNLGSGVNDSTWQSQTSVSSTGRTLYFSSDRAGGFGGKDIYKIVKDSMGYWSEPINLGPKINTAGDEKSPFIHTDDKTIYFCSNGQLGLGGFDIFYARKDSVGEWQKPENIGSPINSDRDDLGFFVSTDGKNGYFASNKMQGVGGWDIYSFPLYEGARPQKVMFLKGKVQDEKGQAILDAKIELKDLKTNEIIHVDVDSSGEYVFARAMDNDQMMLVKKEGFFYNSTTIKANDAKYEGVAKINFGLQELKQGGSYKIKNLFFNNNSAEITEDAGMELLNLVAFLNENPDVNIEVAGHTDNVGNDAANLSLSTNRAKSVHEFLIAHGIVGNRVRYRGYGETKPVATNDSEDGRAMNRRTEVTVL